jgi:carboxyl-terminal processing protease
MNRSRKVALASLALLPILGGAFALQAPSTRSGAQLLGQVLELVEKRFVDTLDTQAVFEKAARGLVKELNDPYTQLFSPKEMADFSRTTNGKYAGLGMEIVPLNGYITAGKTFPNTPAQRGGVLEGDRILMIDTVNAKGFTSVQVQNLLIGDEGTDVSVTFGRTGVAQPIKLTFKRAIIHVAAVPFSMMLDNRVGYIPVARFSEETSAEVDSAVRSLTKQGAKGIVIDMQGNPGGILDEAFSMANLFLPKGKELLSVRGRADSQRYVSEKEPTAPDIPLVVMVDGGSASAAEIVTGALQDYDRALVLGTTSFGKGLVQSVYNLDGGYALKITSGKWYTPSGRSIQKERKMVDGQFVEVMPDSLETDSVRKSRPVFKSASGRTLYGGGAITPDVFVQADTISTPEQAIARIAFGPKTAEFNAVALQFALEQKGKVKPDFDVKQFRGEIYNRLQAAGVKIDRSVYDAGATYIDSWFDRAITRASFGDTLVERRVILPHNVALQKAVALLRKANTQKELYAEAANEPKPPIAQAKRGQK